MPIFFPISGNSAKVAAVDVALERNVQTHLVSRPTKCAIVGFNFLGERVSQPIPIQNRPRSQEGDNSMFEHSPRQSGGIQM